MLLFSTIVFVIFDFYEYYKLPMQGLAIAEWMVESCYVISYIVITTETINYLSLSHPDKVLYGTAALFVGENVPHLILVPVVARLVDAPGKEYTLLSQLIYASFSLIFALFVSTAEKKLFSSKYYPQIEHIRTENLKNKANKKKK